MSHTVNARDLDVLKEALNIGAGKAAGALSTLLGSTPVRISVPVEGALPFTPAMDSAKFLTARVDVQGDGVGRLWFAIPKSDAQRLGTMLLDKPGQPRRLTLTEESALAEVGNIVASATLSSVANLAGATLWPSPPALTQGDLPDQTSWAGAPEHTVSLAIEFQISLEPVALAMLALVLRAEDAQSLVDKIRAKYARPAKSNEAPRGAKAPSNG